MASTYGKMLKKYAFFAIILGGSLTFLSVHLYGKVGGAWETYLTESSEVFALHDELVQKIGYGGFIHDFKNLVLRKDIDRYGKALEQGFFNIKQALDQLSKYDEYSSDSIQVLRETVLVYQQNYELVKGLIRQGDSSEDIDQKVKVDDGPALEALAQFNRHLADKTSMKSDALHRSFVSAMFVHIATFLGFILVLLFFFKQLLEASKKEERLINATLEATQAKSDFLANMSHEVRTPLNGVMGTLQILYRHLSDDKNLKLVGTALSSTRSLLRILNDILDFSKIEAKQLDIEKAEFSLRSLLEFVQSDIAPAASDKSLTFDVAIDGSVPDIWVGDSVRIRQILLNLVSNAVKFTERGSVSISVSKAYHNRMPGLAFQVADTGIGMGKDELDKLFERFTQADMTITRRFGGTGLGMAITQSLVSLMEGDISVESKPDKGSKFVVFLPLDTGGENAVALVEPDTAAPFLEGKTILIAEDVEVNRVVLGYMLEATNATVVFAENGEIAVELYEQCQPDFVFMDIQMPVLDGIQACVRIREQAANLPIVALTANVMAEDIDRYLNKGFTSHVSKPVDMNTVYQVLQKHIG